MHLQFVGCGDAFGSGGRFNTCLHLVGRNINVLIDCGATSLVAMNKLAIDRNEIDEDWLSAVENHDNIFPATILART